MSPEGTTMTETPPEAPTYREPGVEYRSEARTRMVTTVINGKASQHEETYYVDVPVPPRDWVPIVERALFCWACLLIVAAFLSTSASVGGLLNELLPAGVAYVLGLFFTGSWLGLLGLEWLDGRIDPDRAKAASIAGWVALLMGMGAVFVYGYSHDLPWVGAAGACIDLAAKGFCHLLLSRQQVRLPKGVANWVRSQEHEQAATTVLADSIRRLDRRAAYRRAVGGREHQAAQAILSAAEPPARALPDTSGQASAPVSGPVPDPSGPPSAPTPPAPPQPPAAPVPPPAAPVPPVPPVVPAGTGASGSGEGTTGPGNREQETETGTPPGLQPVGPLSIAAAVRQARAEDPRQSDAQMVARVLMLRGGDDGGDRLKFAETVRRTRSRQDNPKKKRSA
jgi:hypothetical protein